MGEKNFSLDCFIVDSEYKRRTLELVYNSSFSIGDLYFQVHIPSKGDCFTFRDLDSALQFLKLNFKI